MSRFKVEVPGFNLEILNMSRFKVEVSRFKVEMPGFNFEALKIIRWNWQSKWALKVW